MRTRSSVSAKKRMRTAPKRSTTNTKGSSQSRRESFETAAIVIDTEADKDADVDEDGDGDGDDDDLLKDELSAIPI